MLVKTYANLSYFFLGICMQNEIKRLLKKLEVFPTFEIQFFELHFLDTNYLQMYL